MQPVELYNKLLEEYGHQGWWPAETPFEVIVGAVLTQTTNWRNVQKAIENLKKRGLMTPQSIIESDLSEIEDAIRPCGYFRIKAKRLINLIQFFYEKFDFDLKRMEEVSLHSLREMILSVRGIGPETADSILLYALNRLTFVVDAYTKRICVRLGIIDENADYYTIKGFLEDSIPQDLELYKDFHAQFVIHGKMRCKKTKPLCKNCPLMPECQFHITCLRT